MALVFFVCICGNFLNITAKAAVKLRSFSRRELRFSEVLVLAIFMKNLMFWLVFAYLRF